jgi:hypothetical protein
MLSIREDRFKKLKRDRRLPWRGHVDEDELARACEEFQVTWPVFIRQVEHPPANLDREGSVATAPNTLAGHFASRRGHEILVYGTPSVDQACRMILHELMHAAQREQPDFSERYEAARQEHGYAQNRFEVEARLAELRAYDLPQEWHTSRQRPGIRIAY